MKVHTRHSKLCILNWESDEHVVEDLIELPHLSQNLHTGWNIEVR